MPTNKPIAAAIITQSDRDRFEAKIDKLSNCLGCWLFTGSIHRDGYGRFGFNRRIEKAHRFAWMLAHGPIPAGLCILHTCDNPRCVNPDHLWLGTNAQNMQDKEEKGRNKGGGRKGEHHLSARLTERQVTVIRALNEAFPDLYTRNRLASYTGLSYSGVRHILNRHVWKH